MPDTDDSQPKLKYRKERVLVGHRGFGPGQISEALRGIAIDAAGRIHVVGDALLVVLDADGRALRSWPTERPGHCVTVTPDGTVYVGEPGQIEIFDADGTRRDRWRDEQRLGLVTSIAVTDEHVIIADVQDRCLRRYDRQGRFLNDIGRDTRMRGFMLPNRHLDFVIDRQNVIHVCNPGQHRVQHYALDGKLLGRFGRFDGRDPAGFTGCCNPTNLALTPEQHIVTVEKAEPRIKVYTRDGRLLAVFGQKDFDPGCKNTDAAVDAQGRIYVIDTVRLHIVVFAPRATTTQPLGEPTTREVNP